MTMRKAYACDVKLIFFGKLCTDEFIEIIRERAE